MDIITDKQFENMVESIKEEGLSCAAMIGGMDDMLLTKYESQLLEYKLAFERLKLAVYELGQEHKMIIDIE